ncbi:hypothetical protein AKJ16_DCAP09474 [Drosera capensis]
MEKPGVSPTPSPIPHRLSNLIPFRQFVTNSSSRRRRHRSPTLTAPITAGAILVLVELNSVYIALKCEEALR